MLPTSSISASRGSLGKVTIPYYVVIKGRGYWRPSAKMRALGFSDVRCGPDGPEAWAVAKAWADKWEMVRTGRAASPAARDVASSDPETAEAAMIYPPGSLGEAFARFRRTDQWKTRRKARTREDWWRGWKRIRPIFGDVAPATVCLEDMDAWRAAIVARAGEREAHRAMKIWRALWKIAAAMGYCSRDDDPSLGVRNSAAPGRSVSWSEGEVVRLVKAAWRGGFIGLAAIMAVIWDTQLSPGDARALTAGQMRRIGRGGAFTARAKTATPVGGVLSARTMRLLEAYLARRGVELMPAAPLFVTKGGGGPKGGRPWQPKAYGKNTLGKEFRIVRARLFGETETRQLADFRRSGAIEAIAGGTNAESLAHAMGNTLDASNTLFETYVPIDETVIRNVAEARRKGRRKMRDGAS